ncbi:hypothetical protein RLIN73S_03945 [Rhodanobacter lindaniclasticus]
MKGTSCCAAAAVMCPDSDQRPRRCAPGLQARHIRKQGTNSHFVARHKMHQNDRSSVQLQGTLHDRPRMHRGRMDRALEHRLIGQHLVHAVEKHDGEDFVGLGGQFQAQVVLDGGRPFQGWPLLEDPLLQQRDGLPDDPVIGLGRGGKTCRSTQESLTTRDMANLQKLKWRNADLGRASAGPGDGKIRRTRCIHHRAAVQLFAARMRKRTGRGQRRGEPRRQPPRPRATWACRRQRRQALRMWGGRVTPPRRWPCPRPPACPWPRARHHPRSAPAARMAWPVWRSSSRSDGVAVTPLLVASAGRFGRGRPRWAARSPCTVRWLTLFRGNASHRAGPGRRCACGHRPIRPPARTLHARPLRRRIRPDLPRPTRPAQCAASGW